MGDVKARVELAKVVHSFGTDEEAYQLVINRGTRDGVKAGQRFLVFGYGPELSDPDTGQSLGRVEIVRGRGEVVHLQDNIATIRSVERRSEGGGKRIIRDSSPFSAGLGRTHVIEEEVPADREQPFRKVRVGDFARPI